IDRAVLQMNLKGTEIISDSPTETIIKFAAGEIWDECVAMSVREGLSGIEALSAIPGTIGATPVQNVGAYGTDISKTFVSLEAYDTESLTRVTLNETDCGFGYRDSVFKHMKKGKLIITSVTLKLSKLPPSLPEYKDVKMYFQEKKIVSPTLLDIRSAIQTIRAKKLPDPTVIPNCGSFFKNPIASTSQAAEILSRYPHMPHYPDVNGIKIPAGWLIETVGLKGHSFGKIAVFSANALVLTAPFADASIEDLVSARDAIIENIKGDFGIQLEMEPEIV
ncbi:MAG: murB, partial [Parcubacteria group bacterium]|nr:murB [Parcubacteria group bacterium]